MAKLDGLAMLFHLTNADLHVWQEFAQWCATSEGEGQRVVDWVSGT